MLHNSQREGEDCDTCIPLGGCIHGGCNEPFECDCDLAKDQNKVGKYEGAHCDIRKLLQLWNSNVKITYIKLQQNVIKPVIMESVLRQIHAGTFNTCMYWVRKISQLNFRCTDGWKGSSCNDCIALPGCIHGYCDGAPNTCKCIQGWQGHLCSQPVCRQSCNLTNGNCMKVG